MVSPLWKLTSRVERALKSYNAWATNVSGSAKEKKIYQIYFGNFLFCFEIFREIEGVTFLF